MVKSLPLICLVNIVRVEELQLSSFPSELEHHTEDNNHVVGGGGKSGRSSVWGNDAATIQWRQLWHNAMSFNTLLDNTERSAGYNTIQYNTIQSLRQQLRSRMTSPGGDDGGALLLLGGHCHNVNVTTSLSQHYGPVWRRNYFRLYLPLHSIFLKSSSATAYREVTVTTSLSQRYGPIWRRNYFRQYLPFQLLSSWNHRLLPPTYQKVTVTTSLSRWWLCVTSQCI